MDLCLPIWMYNNADMVSVVAETEKQYNALKVYFCDKREGRTGYTKIHIDSAMEIYAECQKVIEEAKDDLPDENTVDAEQDSITPASKTVSFIGDEIDSGNDIDEGQEKSENEKEAKEEFEKNIDVKKMTWHELRNYAGELGKKYGVEIPLRATRDSIENKINEVLNGDFNR